MKNFPVVPASSPRAGSLRELASSLALAFAAHPQLTRATMPAPRISNIVLVDGAATDASIWSEVTGILQDRGYRVTAVQCPRTSLGADVAATRRVLEQQTGDVVLAGHSSAGAVMTEAGNATAVKALVYVSALAPDSSESDGDMLAYLQAPKDAMGPDACGLISIADPNAIRDDLAGDAPTAIAQWLAPTSPSIATNASVEKISHAAWHDKPRWYLVAKYESALKRCVQRALVLQLGARTTSVNASHLSAPSHPEVVAALIERAANESNQIPPR